MKKKTGRIIYVIVAGILWLATIQRDFLGFVSPDNAQAIGYDMATLFFWALFMDSISKFISLRVLFRRTFCPFHATFKKLNLQVFWWHRLSKVLFFVGLVLCTLVAYAFTIDNSYFYGEFSKAMMWFLSILAGYNYVMQCLYRSLIYVILGSTKPEEAKP